MSRVKRFQRKKNFSRIKLFSKKKCYNRRNIDFFKNQLVQKENKPLNSHEKDKNIKDDEKGKNEKVIVKYNNVIDRDSFHEETNENEKLNKDIFDVIIKISNNSEESGNKYSLSSQQIIKKKCPQIHKNIFKEGGKGTENTNKNTNKDKKQLDITKIKKKYNLENIRKRIKTQFHKTMKKIINENLIKVGSKEIFDFLPQSFTSSILIEKNRKIINLSYKELLKTDFISSLDGNNLKYKQNDLFKYINNLRTLDYLEKNPEIVKGSGFDLIGDMNYSDLFNEYVISKEFDKSIEKLKVENKSEDYIELYKYLAKNYINYFITKNYKKGI